MIEGIRARSVSEGHIGDQKLAEHDAVVLAKMKKGWSRQQGSCHVVRCHICTEALFLWHSGFYSRDEGMGPEISTSSYRFSCGEPSRAMLMRNPSALAVLAHGLQHL